MLKSRLSLLLCAALSLMGVAQSTFGQKDVSPASGVKADGYFEWVAPHLFYFITKFDGRYGVAASRKELLLVPAGAKEPKVVRRKWPIGDVVYTNSLRAFNDTRP